MTRRFGLALALSLFAVSLAVTSLSPAQAADPIILTVSGKHAETGAPTVIELSLPDIEALESDVLRTTTLWTEGEIAFRGVRMEKLFPLLGLAQPERVRCTALNEYKVELPLRDARETTVLMAYARDGAYMRIRENGPLWIIYPRDSGIVDAPNRMIWQLRKMEAVY